MKKTYRGIVSKIKSQIRPHTIHVKDGVITIKKPVIYYDERSIKSLKYLVETVKRVFPNAKILDSGIDPIQRNRYVKFELDIREVYNEVDGHE